MRYNSDSHQGNLLIFAGLKLSLASASSSYCKLGLILLRLYIG